MKIRALIDQTDKIPAWLQWRITNPFRYMREYTFDIDARHEWAPVGWQFDKDLDILILPRIIVQKDDREAVSKWFSSIRDNGTKIIYECDDDIFSEHYVSQLSMTYWHPDKPIEMLLPLIDELEKRRQNAIWTMQQCDAVTVSTKSLGVYVQTLTTAPVYVIPNAIYTDNFNKGLKPYVKSEYVTVGWAGGLRRENDLEFMIEAWIKLLEQRPYVRFVVAGWMPKIIKDNPVFTGKLDFIKWGDTDQYASSLQVDIGCCSINDNPFGQRKSPIKAWEYALAGASIIASDVVYGEEPIIMLAKDIDEWLMLLKHQVDDGTFRKLHAEMYKNHVMNYHQLKFNWHNWLDTYKEILGGSNEILLSSSRVTGDIH